MGVNAAALAEIFEPLEKQRLRRDERLRRLLHHARQNSPWHAQRLRHLDIDAVTGDDLSAIPVMTKSDLMEHWDDIVTDRRVRLRDANAVVDAVRAGEWRLLLDRYAVLVTGGSTGLRGVFLFDVEAEIPGWTGGMTRFWAWYDQVDPMSDPVVRARVMAASPLHVSAVWRNIYGASPTDHYIPATSPFGEIVQRLNDIQPHSLQVYPSVGQRLAQEAEEGRLSIQPRRVVTSAEPLLPEARAAMEKAFGVIVAEEYGATEGYVGIWNPVVPGMHVSEDDGAYEPVDREHRPVPAGEPSAALLLTNVWSWMLPLIRYELTDEVVFDPAPNPGPLPGRRILSVNGRIDDWLTYDGVRVHPQVFRSALVAHPDIREYQVRQTMDGADIAVVLTASAHLDVGPLQASITKGLAAAGVVDPNVQIMTVTELERDDQSGKVRRFIPLRAN